MSKLAFLLSLAVMSLHCIAGVSAAGEFRTMKYAARNSSEAATWQRQVRSKLAGLLKMDDLLPKRGSFALDAKELLPREAQSSFISREIEINSTPTRRMKIVLTIPANFKGPRPAVVCIHGHGGDRHAVYDANSPYKAFAAALTEKGFVTISTDVGQHAVYEKGRTLIGERLWDLMRCVDYLQSLAEVDKTRIGCAGLSLGGEMAMWLGAMDGRVNATVSSGFLARMDQLEKKHCACWKFPGLREAVDFADIYCLIAPRPLLCQNGLQEPEHGFTVPIAREEMKQIEAIYTRFNWRENVSLIAHPGGHETDIPSLLDFFAKHLQAGMTHPDFEFIDTGFENASPLWYDVAADGTIQIYLTYDRERSTGNRASTHFHFQLQGRPGATLTIELKNIEQVYNGKPGSTAKELKAVVISPDGRNWKAVPTESLPDSRVRLTVRMPGPRLYVARVEPYRLSDLEKLLAAIRNHRLVEITPIGKTVEGRDLEIVRVGDSQAPYRIFIRARAHAWEAGGNWVVQGLIRRLLKDDAESKRFLERYCIWIMPMANKDAVAHGRSRFNLQGMDLNRNCDKPADPRLAPENAALEKWLEGQIAARHRPHLAIDFHNCGSNIVFISRPPVAELKRHVERMTTFEKLLRKHTWFTEPSVGPTVRTPGSLGEGWLARYGIDAIINELSCQWIPGLKDYPSGRYWEDYGANLTNVFYEYFDLVKP